MFRDDSTQSGIISFSDHVGDWFQPRSAKDFSIVQGREIPQDTPLSPDVADSDHKIVSIDKLLDKAERTLCHNASVVVYGGRGAGKTALLRELSNRMNAHLFCLSQCLHALTADTVHASCSSLSNSSLSVIKDMLQKTFIEATFHAPSLVLFDDLERLIPAELEHADSTRSRQIAEIFLHIVRPAVYRRPIVLLASAPSSESLHSVVTNGFVFREAIALKAPDKEARQIILESCMNEITGLGIADDFDYLDVARISDGYLPGDLHALIGRARQEAIVRCITKKQPESLDLKVVDFENAVAGYVPASLRGVKLQKSSVEWNDIGGLLTQNIVSQ